MPDALQLLRDDHKKVKDLFKQFGETEDVRSRGAIVQEALKELTIHAELEEEIFYPAVRQEAGIEEDKMDEADEEHRVAKVLIAELQKMRPTSSHFIAKFTVLAESVRHHIDEEESEMLPKAAELGMSRMDELGMEMERRKMELMKNGLRRVTSTSRKSTAGTSRRRTTAGGSGNGRSSRTTSRATTRTRPVATASTRTTSRATSPTRRPRTASTRSTGASSKKTASTRKTTGSSSARGRSTGGTARSRR